MERPSGEHRFLPCIRSRTMLLVAVLLLWAFCCGATVAFAVQLTASLDRDTITLGESATLSLTYDGQQSDAPPTLPAIPNLQVIHVGQSSQVSIVNNQVSSTVTHNFQVTPRQPGDYIIPALAKPGGQATLPLRLKVLKPTAPLPDAVNSGSQIAFMRLVVPKTNVYLGEILSGELQLYLRDGVQGIAGFNFTGQPAEGISLGKMIETQRRRAQIGNAGYTVVPLAVALTPIKTGPLSVGPITANAVLDLPAGNNRRRDMFDPFGMFNQTERKQISLASETVNIQCQPLPTENAPANFNGAVGNFTLKVSAGPTNVATGDPITVRVEITGRGALDALTLPEQTGWHDFKTYPPTADTQTTDQLGLQGKKTFEQIVSPGSTDIKELPAFSFSFFDPETRGYHTLTHPPTKLVVRPGGSAPVPVIAVTRLSKDEPPQAQLDIVPIKQRLGAVRRAGPPLLARPGFIVVQGVPVLAFIGAFIWRRRADALANNPRLRRHRQVEQIVRDGLGDLRRLANQNSSDEFFATLVRLLQEQLGERLDCPASAITEAVIDEKLRPRGVPDNTLELLRELFQLCNLARYAPVKSSQELAAMIPKLESTLEKIREVKL